MGTAGNFVFFSSCFLVAIICSLTLHAANGASLFGELEAVNSGDHGVLIMKNLGRMPRDIQHASNGVHNLHTMTNNTAALQTTTEPVTESTERNEVHQIQNATSGFAEIWNEFAEDTEVKTKINKIRSTRGANQARLALLYNSAEIVIEDNIIVCKTSDDDVLIRWSLENGSPIDEIDGLEGSLAAAHIYKNARRVLLETDQGFYVVDFGTNEAVQITGLPEEAEVLSINNHLTNQFYFTEGNMIYFVRRTGHTARCLNCGK